MPGGTGCEVPWITPGKDVVVEVFADARQFSHNWNIELPEVIRITDAGEHEKLGRFDGPGTDDGFVFSPDCLETAILTVFHADDSAGLRTTTGCLGIGAEGDVGPLQGRPEISFPGAAAFAVPDVDVMPARPLPSGDR